MSGQGLFNRAGEVLDHEDQQVRSEIRFSERIKSRNSEMVMFSNWLFANTPGGAKTSAIIYSIVETARENGLNPFDYLKYAFERIKTTAPASIDSLLSWNDDVQGKLRSGWDAL